MNKRFSLRTILATVAVIGVLLVLVLQERERRRLDAKFQYAVWRLENSQAQIAAMDDAHDEWHSAMIKKYGGTVAPDKLGEVFMEFKGETERLNMYLSHAWLITGWDGDDEENSAKGPPQ